MAVGTTAEQGNIDENSPVASRERLITTIVEQVRCAGFYLAHLDPQPHQGIIDLRWAAQVAGRTMHRQVRTWASVVGATVPGKVTVIVAPTDFVSPDEAARKAAVLLLVENILTVPGHGAPHRSVA